MCVYMNHSTSTNDLKMKVKNKSLLFLFLTTKSALYNGNIYNYTISWLIVSIFMINLPINSVKSIRGDSLEHKFYIFDYLDEVKLLIQYTYINSIIQPSYQ